jgi:hypothetical protein
MTELIARFAVDDWDVRPVEGISTGGEDDWVGVAQMHKAFTSGLVGSSTVLFLSSGVEGQRSYLAAERITATVGEGGEQGEVTLHHGGLEADPSSVFGHVVRGTGTGAMAGWSGSARIEHDGQGAYVVFDLS